MCAVVVSNGIDHCRVGYLPEAYPHEDQRLQGRLVQVVEILDESKTARKRALSAVHDGICIAAVIDQVQLNDAGLDLCMADYNTDSSVDE